MGLANLGLNAMLRVISSSLIRDLKGVGGEKDDGLENKMALSHAGNLLPCYQPYGKMLARVRTSQSPATFEGWIPPLSRQLSRGDDDVSEAPHPNS